MCQVLQCQELLPWIPVGAVNTVILKVGLLIEYVIRITMVFRLNVAHFYFQLEGIEMHMNDK